MFSAKFGSEGLSAQSWQGKPRILPHGITLQGAVQRTRERLTAVRTEEDEGQRDTTALGCGHRLEGASLCVSACDV